MLCAMFSRLHPLPVRQPFCFEHSLRFLEAFRPMEGEQRSRAGTLEKAVQIDGETIVFRVSEGETGLMLEALSAARARSPELEHKLIDRVRFFLSLDDDLLPFYALAEADPIMRPIAQALHGYHQVKLMTPFETTCWAILSQRCPIPVARRMKDRLTERFGGALLGHRAFPEAAALEGVDPEELDATLGATLGPRGRRIAAAARAFAGVDERYLRSAPSEEVDRWLRKIEGVGPWSSAFIRLRGLGRTDDLTGSEGQLLPSIAAVYGLQAAARPIDVLRLGARYGDHRGTWALYVRTYGARAERGEVARSA